MDIEVKEVTTYQVWLDGFLIGVFYDPYWASYLGNTIKNEDKDIKEEVGDIINEKKEERDKDIKKLLNHLYGGQ